MLGLDLGAPAITAITVAITVVIMEATHTTTAITLMGTATLATETTADMGTEAITVDMAEVDMVGIMVVAAATVVGDGVAAVDVAAVIAKNGNGPQSSFCMATRR
jgi:hypothetical protein